MLLNGPSWNFDDINIDEIFASSDSEYDENELLPENDSTYIRSTAVRSPDIIVDSNYGNTEHKVETVQENKVNLNRYNEVRSGSNVVSNVSAPSIDPPRGTVQLNPRNDSDSTATNSEHDNDPHESSKSSLNKPLRKRNMYSNAASNQIYNSDYKIKVQGQVQEITKEKCLQSRQIEISHELRGFQHLWPRFNFFNPVQSYVFDKVFKTNENIVVSAPTGCGKTCIFEMAIAQLIQSNTSLKKIKVIYIAPIKALCKQLLDDWTPKFEKYGMKVTELTGDICSENSLQEVAQGQIILTTPEKWDSITRQWTKNVYLLGAVRLLLLDEIHFLDENSRGATLELVVTRMKSISKSPIVSSSNLPAKSMRIIALSATLPNIDDVGVWLESKPDCVFAFAPELRPVPLSIHVHGYNPGKNEFLFNRNLESRVADIISRYSAGKNTLIFCDSKKSTETLAKVLASTRTFINDPATRAVLCDAAKYIEAQRLRDLIIFGVAYHNAGLSNSDRMMVEGLMRDGCLKVLTSTTTLALGINMPAHLVIIKGTCQWQGSEKGYEKLPISTVLQMVGRAGRPGFDTKGVAVIMTTSNDKDHYEKVAQGQDKVESHLMSRILESLNSEISSEVIDGLDQGIFWLKSTFYYLRCLRNPSYYKFSNIQSQSQLETELKTKCVEALKELHENKLVHLDSTDLNVSALPAGIIMSKNMVAFCTMKVLMSLEGDSGIREVLACVSQAVELLKPVRMAEKKLLNELAKETRYNPPPNAQTQKGVVKIKSPQEKTWVLLQLACATDVEISDFSLRMEQSEMVRNARRILKACYDYCSQTNKSRATLSSLLLMRSLDKGMWEKEDSRVLMQLEGIGRTMADRLAQHGVQSFQDVMERRAHELNEIAGKRHPFGSELIRKVSSLLARSFSMKVYRSFISENTVRLKIKLVPSTFYENTDSGQNHRYTNYHLVSYVAGSKDKLLLCRKFNSQHVPEEVTVEISKDAIKREKKSTKNAPENTSSEKAIVYLFNSYVGLDDRLVIEPFAYGSELGSAIEQAIEEPDGMGLIGESSRLESYSTYLEEPEGGYLEESAGRQEEKTLSSEITKNKKPRGNVSKNPKIAKQLTIDQAMFGQFEYKETGSKKTAYEVCQTTKGSELQSEKRLVSQGENERSYLRRKSEELQNVSNETHPMKNDSTAVRPANIYSKFAPPRLKSKLPLQISQQQSSDRMPPLSTDYIHKRKYPYDAGADQYLDSIPVPMYSPSPRKLTASTVSSNTEEPLLTRAIIDFSDEPFFESRNKIIAEISPKPVYEKKHRNAAAPKHNDVDVLEEDNVKIKNQETNFDFESCFF